MWLETRYLLFPQFLLQLLNDFLKLYFVFLPPPRDYPAPVPIASNRPLRNQNAEFLLHLWCDLPQGHKCIEMFVHERLKARILGIQLFNGGLALLSSSPQRKFIHTVCLHKACPC